MSSSDTPVRRFMPHGAGLALYLAAVSWFARNQEIWTDETTQLSGLRLNPLEVVSWLAGADRQRFGVPGDRMPPLSYWTGWVWSQIFGLSEGSLRALSVCAVGVALVLVIETARQRFGQRSAWLAAVAVALGPNWLTFGAEIRTYPFLLLASAVACFALGKLMDASKERALRYWVLLAVACLAAAYAHFFGLVLSGAVFCCSLWILWQRRLSWKPPALLTFGFLLSCAGLVPFVRSAFEMSHGPDSGPSHFPISSLVRLVFRLFGGHPAHSFSVLPGVLVVLGTAACIGLSVLCPKRTLFQVCLGLCLALGLGADLFVGVLAHGFDPFTASYNVWLMPPVALLLAGCAAEDRSGWLLLGARVAGAIAVLGVLLGAGNLVLHPKVYAHGPAARVSALVQLTAQGELTSVAVLHDNAEAWGHSYFPLLYEYGVNLQQVLVKDSAEGKALELLRLPEQTPIDIAELRSKRLLLATTKNEGASELGRFVRLHQVPEIERAPLVAELLQLGCHKLGSQTYVALISAEMSTLQCK